MIKYNGSRRGERYIISAVKSESEDICRAVFSHFAESMVMVRA